MAETRQPDPEGKAYGSAADAESDENGAIPAPVLADVQAGGSGMACAPPAELQLNWITWEKQRVIHRIHLDKYQGDTFNPGTKGNARFSPIKDAQENAIPTLYGGDSFECAAMETIFHDVPYSSGVKIYDKAKLSGQMHTQLTSAHDLHLADLSSKALRKLGVRRNQLIDTEKDQYPITRQWAEAIHAQHPDAHGLCWTSRQDDSAKAVMLFGDRIRQGALIQLTTSSTVTSDPIYGQILALAEVLGVNIVPGKE